MLGRCRTRLNFGEHNPAFGQHNSGFEMTLGRLDRKPLGQFHFVVTHRQMNRKAVNPMCNKPTS